MFNGKKFKLSSVIVAVTSSLVVLAAVALAVYLFRDSGKETFSVTYGGVTLRDGDLVDLPESGQARFDVDTNAGYSVRVVPNVTDENDFSFTVSGDVRSFSGEKEFTGYFVSAASKQTDYFTVSCSYERYAVENVMSYYYGDAVYAYNVPAYPFKFIIASAGGSSVSFGLRQINREKTIGFDKSGDVIF